MARAACARRNVLAALWYAHTTTKPSLMQQHSPQHTHRRVSVCSKSCSRIKRA